MKKSQYYYYEDEGFQLELNLQNIRRDLVGLLEGYIPHGCFECNRLKCCCSNESSTFDSTTLSIFSSDSAYPRERDRSMDAYYNVAPPPETLPMPKWKQLKKSDGCDSQNKVPKDSVATITTWIKASLPNTSQSDSTINFPVPKKVLEHVNYTWPPFPKSIWSGEMVKKTTAREDRLINGKEGDGNNSVEEFFSYFKGNGLGTKSMF